MEKAFKYRIYPNQKQRLQIAKTIGCVRLVYNDALDCRNDVIFLEIYKDLIHSAMQYKLAKEKKAA